MTHEPRLLINIDVPDIEAGLAFYTAALGLHVGRRFDAEFVELLGAEAPIYLLKKDAGTPTAPGAGERRRYSRHWCPVHPDFVIEDMDVAIARATAAGAVQEGKTREAPYGRLAMFADPFGHGFCLIEFKRGGYDALLPKAAAQPS